MCTQMHTHRICSHTFTDLHMHTHTCTHAHIHTYTLEHVHTNTHNTSTSRPHMKVECARINTHIYARKCKHICNHTYTHTHIHIHIHTYTHTIYRPAGPYEGQVRPHQHAYIRAQYIRTHICAQTYTHTHANTNIQTLNLLTSRLISR